MSMSTMCAAAVLHCALWDDDNEAPGRELTAHAVLGVD